MIKYSLFAMDNHGATFDSEKDFEDSVSFEQIIRYFTKWQKLFNNKSCTLVEFHYKRIS